MIFVQVTKKGDLGENADFTVVSQASSDENKQLGDFRRKP